MAPNDMTLSRRGLLAAGGGLAFALTLHIPAEEAAAQPAAPQAIGAWVRIAPDGTITIRAPAAEMGQGVQTIVPLILAEEMDADWARVRVETAPVAEVFHNPAFRSQFTVASLTVKGYWTPARLAGAQVRRVLMQAAAERWGVALEAVRTEPSVVIGPAGQRLSYGEIAAFARVPDPLPAIRPEELKPASAYRLLGRDVARVDVAAKSSGEPVFAADIRLPGMLYATVARSPASGQRVAGFNREEVAAMPGITHLLDLGHGVAVVGRSLPQVFAARAALRIRWSGNPPGAAVDSERDKALYLAHLRDPNRRPDVVFSRTGDAPAALQTAARTLTREYVSEYCYHAQMEPMGAVAHVRADGADVWTGTQWQTMAAMKTARITGLPPERVRIHQLMLGGGFGRRAHTEYIDDVVTIAKQVGAPVKLLLSREDDLASGRLRPLTAQRVTMGLDAEGRIVALRHVVACEPVTPYMYGPERWRAVEGRDLITMRGSSLPHYAVPNQIAEHIHEMRGARVAAWRGIGCGYTKFALETMVDEIARDLGRDPLAYRIAMAANPRTRAVLERVREMSGWPNAREGRHLGCAFAEYGDSLNATVVEISLDRTSGRIRVHRLWAAVDVGLPLQPNNIVAQIQGGAIFGISAALKEEVTIRDGAVVQRNFHDYPILRADESPEIEVAILRGSDTPTEVGELGLPPVAPAIANAVRAATGKGLYHLPMTPERVRAALAG